MTLPDWLRRLPLSLRGRRSALADAQEGVTVRLETLLGLRGLARHFLLSPRRPPAGAQPVGYRARVRGRGLDFDAHRDYQPGDDTRHIDWRVSARTGRAHTRLYREERERAVYVVVDYRPAMCFASRGRFKSVLAAQAAALLAWAAAEDGDHVGGLVFGEQGLDWFEPRARRHGVLPLLQCLASRHAPPAPRPEWARAPAQAARPTGLPEEALSHVLHRLDAAVHPGSLILVLSDFAGLDAAAESRLARLARRCDVLGGFLYDPLEQALPEQGRYWISDGEAMALLDADDPAVRAAHAAAFRQHHDRVVHAFVTLRLHLLRLATHHSPDESLRRLFQVHARLRRAA